MPGTKVLVLGSGGREYAFAWKFAMDGDVSEIYCAPGNGGTHSFCINLNLDINNHKQVLETIIDLGIDMTVVGPEGPLANGIVDVIDNNSFYPGNNNSTSGLLAAIKRLSRA